MFCLNYNIKFISFDKIFIKSLKKKYSFNFYIKCVEIKKKSKYNIQFITQK